MDAYYFSYNMKRRRIELGMSQGDLAIAIGVAQNTISEYENNVRYPPLDRVYDIANALDTKADTLIRGDMYKDESVEKRKRIVFL